MNIFRMIKKADIFLALALLASAGAVSLYPSVSQSAGRPLDVMITQNGEVYGIYDLSEDRVIDTGSNTIVIEKGSVYMKDADCRNRICVRKGKISSSGETIVCLPNRIVVEINGYDSKYDAVTR